MKINLDTSIVTQWQLAPESEALAAWYDGHSVVRRLWGVRAGQELRVIVAIDATHDNDDILPVWLTNHAAWLRELRECTGGSVTLELCGSYPFDSIGIEPRDVLIADLCWRDSTVDAFDGREKR